MVLKSNKKTYETISHGVCPRVCRRDLIHWFLHCNTKHVFFYEENPSNLELQRSKYEPELILLKFTILHDERSQVTFRCFEKCRALIIPSIWWYPSMAARLRTCHYDPCILTLMTTIAWSASYLRCHPCLGHHSCKHGYLSPNSSYCHWPLTMRNQQIPIVPIFINMTKWW